MKTKYMITKHKGQYEAKFETSMQDKPMLVEGLAGAVGAQILYQGNLDDIKKALIVLDVVKKANKTGEFDSKLLESRLDTSTPKDK